MGGTGRKGRTAKKTATKNCLPSRRIASREIEGQILVLLPNDTDIYTFNPAGTLIWKGLIRGQSQAHIARTLAKAFGIDRARAEADVARFIREMVKRRVLDYRNGRSRK